MDLSKPKPKMDIGEVQKTVPFVVSAHSPALFEIDIDAGESDIAQEEEEKKSANSRY